ncbi:hypothetical protein BGZ63DRAFT_222451 [Mariannaea sp. PMI_226]|nr:hypothetical protein BGZ63DRAFT_222451 [Mariannaea sp. PMI_226]
MLQHKQTQNHYRSNCALALFLSSTNWTNHQSLSLPGGPGFGSSLVFQLLHLQVINMQRFRIDKSVSSLAHHSKLDTLHKCSMAAPMACLVQYFVFSQRSEFRAPTPVAGAGDLEPVNEVWKNGHAAGQNMRCLPSSGRDETGQDRHERQGYPMQGSLEKPFISLRPLHQSLDSFFSVPFTFPSSLLSPLCLHTYT